jgi:hypothetical protein
VAGPTSVQEKGAAAAPIGAAAIATAVAIAMSNGVPNLGVKCTLTIPSYALLVQPTAAPVR